MEWFDPFAVLGGASGKLVTDSWTALMMAIWSGGLWVLRIVLQLESALLVPDITATGPARQVYGLTAWIAVSLVVVMLMIQLGVAAVRRDGKSLGQVLVGAAQFVVVWTCWIAYGVAVITACGEITKALMQPLFGVDSIAEWEPFGWLAPEDVTDATVATVLGMLGGLLWLAGIAHLLVLLTRAGALIVLSVTTPISAAGLLSEVGRSWFWKSFRWFHAAAFTPVVMTLMMGIGIQLAGAVALDADGGAQAAVGSALPAVGMILMSAVAPLALFKLLAFVEPGTNSGAAGRAGMSAIGGLSGLFGGGGQSGSNLATSADANGRSAGEQQAEATGVARMAGGAAQQAAASSGGGLAAVGAVLGPVGAAVATGLRMASAVGGAVAAVGTDLTNQMGVGHHTYQPDWQNPAGSRPPQPDNGQGNTDDRSDEPPDSTSVSHPAVSSPSSEAAPVAAESPASVAAKAAV